MAPTDIGREVLVRWNHGCSREMQDAPTSSWWALETLVTLARRGSSGRTPSGGHGGGGGAIGGEIVQQPSSHVFFNTARSEGY